MRHLDTVCYNYFKMVNLSIKEAPLEETKSEPPVFLTIKETAELLRVTESTVFRFLRQKLFRSAKIGRQRRLIYREDVMKYIHDRLE